MPPQIVPRVNPAPMTIVPGEADRISPDRRDIFRQRGCLIQGKQLFRRRLRITRLAAVIVALFIAGRARAAIAQPTKAPRAVMTVLPVDLHARALRSCAPLPAPDRWLLSATRARVAHASPRPRSQTGFPRDSCFYSRPRHRRVTRRLQPAHVRDRPSPELLLPRTETAWPPSPELPRRLQGGLPVGVGLRRTGRTPRESGWGS